MIVYLDGKAHAETIRKFDSGGRNRMRKTKLLLLLSILCLSLAAATPVQADQLYGTIRGTVTDQSGAVIPGAAVTATDVGTGISRQVTSAVDGSFEFLNMLAPATYNVAVEQTGFRKYVSSNIQLNVNQTYVVNATLQVGSTAQEITVQAAPAQIETTSMQLGATITGRAIVDLPLNGRNWVQLQQLQPGVVGATDRLGSDYSTNGAETQQNSYLINGVDSNEMALNTVLVVPSPDAIAEFRMVTNTINPEYGRNSGAILNAVIKSGANQIHGDGFEFFRDTSLDARGFFSPTVAPFHQNQFGGTIGGPVLLPHIYNGKNRTFFFFSYQGTRNAVPENFTDCGCVNPGTTTVFSPAERTGNFSADGLATAAGKSAFPLVGDNGVTYPAGTPYSTIFSNGQIPTADLNPLAVKLMNQFVPSPNGPSNQYRFNPTLTGLDDQYLWRIDENIRPQDSVWAYGLWERNFTSQTLPFEFGATLPGFGETDGDHTQEYTIAWNHIFSPNTLNEARFGYSRLNFVAVNPANPVNPTAYGFNGIFPENAAEASLPAISVTGLFNLGFSTNGPQPRIDNVYVLTDNLSKVVGRHTFKLGFSMQRFEVFNPFNSALSGFFDFTGSGPFSTGLPGADFLLGLPGFYSQASGSINNGRAQEYYSYFQDQFKIRPNFTLTYGLGWDIETPYWNLYAGGEAAPAFRPGVQSKVFPTAPVGLLFPGDPGINNAGGPNIPWRDFAPRLGFAWSPGSSGKWSLRGGFGLYYNRTAEEAALQNFLTPPFSISSIGVGSIGGSPSFAAPFSGWCPGSGGGAPTPCSTANVFPFTPPAPGTPVNFAPYEPFSGLNVFSPNYGVPMAENFNLTLERQLTNSMVLSIGYVGSAGHHLEGIYEGNPAGQFPGVNPSAVALGCSAVNLGSCDPSSFKYNPAIYGSIGYEATGFNSNYNSLQVSLNKRFSHGLEFLVSYTWSRYFDYTSSFENGAGAPYMAAPAINPLDLNSMYAPSVNDAPQRLVISYDYTLPFYHFVHRFRRLTDGWKIAGITTFQHGTPVAVYDSAFSSLTCNLSFTFYGCPDRPNQVAPAASGNPRTYTINGGSNYWFNPASFAAPAPGVIGNASRNPLYGPGINNFDLSLIKDIPLAGEDKYIELRLEAFDVFNHAQFANPIGDFNAPNFGQVTSVNQLISSESGARVLQLAGKIYF